MTIKLMKISDYFDNHEAWLKEAFIFCAHKDLNDYAQYMYDDTVLSMLRETSEPYRVMHEFRDEIETYSNTIIKELEDWEEYEVCDAVLIHQNFLLKELSKIIKKL